MKILGSYKNGNYQVTIFSDGTKIRENDLDFLDPEFPECLDYKITDQCDLGCSFCHEDSKPDGNHGDILNQHFIETLKPYTELAIGGGNPLAHPDLKLFLIKCRDLKLIANITVNQKHFLRELDRIGSYIDEKLIYGLGVSISKVTPDLIKVVKEFPNIVLHTINGVMTVEDFKKLYDKNLKVLILGYKQFRRGKSFYNTAVESNMTALFDELPELIKHLPVTSFDNLALKQLEVKRLMSEKDWERFFMGDDGKFTMYVDGVKKEFARNSISTERIPLKDDIFEMFNTVK